MRLVQFDMVHKTTIRSYSNFSWKLCWWTYLINQCGWWTYLIKLTIHYLCKLVLLVLLLQITLHYLIAQNSSGRQTSLQFFMQHSNGEINYGWRYTQFANGSTMRLDFILLNMYNTYIHTMFMSNRPMTYSSNIISTTSHNPHNEK